jgi:hypothetical protein
MLKTLNRKIIGDWKAHWKRFFAAWIVVTMGVAFYGAFYPAGKSLLTSIYVTYDQLAYMDFVVSVDQAPAEIVKQVREIEGVSAADGRIVVESGIQLDPAQSSLTNLRLISVPDKGAATVNRSDIPTGRGIQAADEILLLKRFADYHHIQPGDSVKLWINGAPHDFKVAGLAFNPEYLVAGRSREMPFPAPSAFGVASAGWRIRNRLVRAACPGAPRIGNDFQGLCRPDDSRKRANRFGRRDSSQCPGQLSDNGDVFGDVFDGIVSHHCHFVGALD